MIDFNDLQPLDFAATLDKLVEWSGCEVHAVAISNPPGEPLTATNLSVRGALSRIAMTDNYIDADADSVAAFAIGEARNTGFHLSKSHFLRSQPLPGLPGTKEAIRIDFTHSYSIQVLLIE